MNKIKEKLARGGTVFVLNPNFPSPPLVEYAAELGFDAIVIGLADLAQSLGHPSDGKHADVRRVVDAVIAATKNSGRTAAGFNLHRWEEGGELTGKGVRWLTIHAKGMLARGAQQLHALLGDRAAK